MTPLSLEKLEMRALRGVVDLSLPFDGKTVVILGENGFGKSSIVDGLEFFFTGELSALEGTQGISTTRHAPHVGFERSSTSVTLTVNPGSRALTRSFSLEPSGSADVTTFLADGGKASFILRRSQLLKFILTKPAERYQAISPLIGVERLDDWELGLKSVRDDLRGVVSTRQAECDATSQDAKSTVGLSPTEPDTAALASLNALRADAGLSALVTIESVADTPVSTPASEPRTSGARELEQATIALGLLPDTESLPRILEDFQTLRDAAASLVAKKNLDQLPLLEFLRRGHQYVTQVQTTVCPLCEQPIITENLLASLNRRIGELDSLSAEATTFRERLATTREAVSALERRFAELQGPIAAIGIQPGVAEVSTAGIDVAGRLGSILSKTESPRDLPDSSQAEELLGALRPRCASLREELQHVLSQARARSVDSAVRLASASDTFRRWGRARRLLSESQRASVAASAVFDHFVAARHQGVEELYAAIQADLTRFYSVLHPAESHRDIVLKPSTERRASTILQLTSFDQPQMDPRAYASEAHLDTLGLCIFLAFAKVFLSDFPLLVLDDVLTTVDAQHRQRVTELLLDEFPSTQLVLTTHDEIWFEEIKALARSHGYEGRFLYYTIASWTREGGPDIRQSKSNWDRVQQLLAEGEKNLAGNEARRYAEWVTQEICRRTDASLPFSAIEKLELGVLLPGAKARLLDLIRDRAASDAIASEFRSIEATTFLANLLSHHNVLAWNLTVDEVRAFATAVNGLHTRFSCNGCHSMLVYSRDLHELACPRRTCGNKTRYQTR